MACSGSGIFGSVFTVLFTVDIAGVASSILATPTIFPLVNILHRWLCAVGVVVGFLSY